ncbi:MAG: hypothetical protein AAFU70_04490 [Planctomycetota bacterium]
MSSSVAQRIAHRDILRSGEPAPGLFSTTLREFQIARLGGGGRFSFTAYLDAPLLIPDDEYESLWEYDDGSISLIARERLSAPGTDGQFENIFSSARTANGQVLFNGNLLNQGTINALNDQGTWVWKDGTLEVLAYEGQAVAGARDATYHFLLLDAIAGDYLGYRSLIRVGGLSEPAVFRYDATARDDPLSLIAREGSLIGASRSVATAPS